MPPIPGCATPAFSGQFHHRAPRSQFFYFYFLLLEAATRCPGLSHVLWRDTQCLWYHHDTPHASPQALYPFILYYGATRARHLWEGGRGAPQHQTPGHPEPPPHHRNPKEPPAGRFRGGGDPLEARRREEAEGWWLRGA